MQVNSSDIHYRKSTEMISKQSTLDLGPGPAIGTCTGTVVQTQPRNPSRPNSDVEHHSVFEKCLPLNFHKGHPVIIFRPIEAKFNNEQDILGKIDPYCKFKIGWHRGKSRVAKQRGKHPVWSDAITLKVKKNQDFAKIKVKDKDRLRPDEILGKAKIPLSEVIVAGKVTQWIPLNKGDQITGEILVQMDYQFY